MNIETGKILNNKEFKEKLNDIKDEKEKNEFIKKHISMQIPPTIKQMKKRKVGRNDPCPCGSEKKFKKCCLDKKENL